MVQQQNKEYYEVYTQKCMAFLVSKGFIYTPPNYLYDLHQQ